MRKWRKDEVLHTEIECDKMSEYTVLVEGLDRGLGSTTDVRMNVLMLPMAHTTILDEQASICFVRADVQLT